MISQQHFFPLDVLKLNFFAIPEFLEWNLNSDMVSELTN